MSMFVHIQIAYTFKCICIYVFSISIFIYKCVSWRNHESGQMNLPENHNLEFLLYFGEFCSVESALDLEFLNLRIIILKLGEFRFCTLAYRLNNVLQAQGDIGFLHMYTFHAYYSYTYCKPMGLTTCTLDCAYSLLSGKHDLLCSS